MNISECLLCQSYIIDMLVFFFYFLALKYKLTSKMNYPCQTGLLINGRVLIKTRWKWTASAYKRTVVYKQAVIYKELDLIDGDCLLRHKYDENLLYFISASTSAASTLPVSSTQFSSSAGIVINKADN